jgi:hypothetical protein
MYSCQISYAPLWKGGLVFHQNVFVPTRNMRASNIVSSIDISQYDPQNIGLLIKK